MPTSTTLAIAGAIAGSIGSIITAFGANSTLRALHLGQEAHNETIRKLLSSSPGTPTFTGLDRQFDNAGASGARLVWLGVVLLALGFISQALSVLSSSH